MAELVDLLLQTIAEAQVAFLAFDAAVLSIEREVFPVNSIATRLAHISIQSKRYGGASRTESGLSM